MNVYGTDLVRGMGEGKPAALKDTPYTYKIGYPKEGRSQGLVLCRDTREQDSFVFFTADVAT